MSKTRPFLIGTALGASAMFFSLQYHVVHSTTGLQVVPRSPQQSIGLAYADIRNWSPTQWADRPEVARALMANGSSDLIAASVVDSLTDSPSDDATTFDQLRDFLKKSREGLTRSAQYPSAVTDPQLTAVGDAATDDHEDPGQPIPFPTDAGSKPLADPFRRPTPPAAVRQEQSRFSNTDVLDGLTQPRDKSSGNTRANSLIDQAREVERKIFGDEETPLESSTTRRKSDSTDAPAPLFEEVTAALENEAQRLLDEIRQTDAGRSSVATSLDSTARFNRNTAPAEPGTTPAAPAAEAPVTDDFDPFLE